MPDVIRVRYLGDASATIPLAGRDVDPDCVFDVPGRVLDEAEHRAQIGAAAGVPFTPDHYLVETGNPAQLIALPRSTYRVETPPKTSAAAKTAGAGKE